MKSIQGNYKDIYTSYQTTSGYLRDKEGNTYENSTEMNPKKIQSDVLKDLPRTCFIISPQGNINNLKFLHFFTQGDLDGGALGCLLTQGIFLNQTPIPVNDLRFSYVNDEGQLCGFNIVYQQDNPQKFCISHIEDSDKKLTDRKVTMITNLENISDIQFTQAISTINDTLKQVIKSQLIVDLLQPIFKGSQLNIKNLINLGSRLTPNRNLDNYDVKRQLLTILENKILNDKVQLIKLSNKAFGDLAWSDDQFTQSLIKLFNDSPEKITSALIQDTLKELTNQPYQSALAKMFSYQTENSGDELPSAVQHVIFIFLNALLNFPNLDTSALEEIVTSTTKYFNQAGKEYNQLITQVLNNTSTPTISLTNIARTSQNIEIAKLVLSHRNCSIECASTIRNNQNFSWKKHFSFKLKCFLAIYRKSIFTYCLPAISSMYQLGAIYWIGLLQPQTLWTGIVSIIIVSLLSSTSYHSQQTYIVWPASLLMVCAQTVLISFLPIPLTNIQMLSLIVAPAFLCLFSYSLASSLLTIKLSENPTQSSEVAVKETALPSLTGKNDDKNSQNSSHAPVPAQ
ncbi:hypothetical protein N9Y17_03450 [Gammaproteobacteria bacterium]|nr:hypothetical protein [Gammaproteobacteria bacterium]